MCRFLLLIGLAIMVSTAAPAQTPPPLLQRPLEVTDTVEVTGAQNWKFIVSHPTPEYPLGARRRHLEGKGLYRLHVSEATGDVTSVEILTSTGHRVLDDSAVATLKKWKFRPHTMIGVKVPIAFTMSSHTTGKKPKT